MGWSVEYRHSLGQVCLAARPAAFRNIATVRVKYSTAEANCGEVAGDVLTKGRESHSAGTIENEGHNFELPTGYCRTAITTCVGMVFPR